MSSTVYGKSIQIQLQQRPSVIVNNNKTAKYTEAKELDESFGLLDNEVEDEDLDMNTKHGEIVEEP